ncbi:MAG TPA: hypothetical protein DC031_06055, partial [Sulfitobacter sp.]|nr:hypothetical protein [Sulfitobacter sp.]
PLSYRDCPESGTELILLAFSARAKPDETTAFCYQLIEPAIGISVVDLPMSDAASDAFVELA